MDLATCPACDGLVPAAARACPHCDRPRPARRTWLGRALRAAAAAGATMTLMACYGMIAEPSGDDCLDGDGDGWFPACYDAPCDPEVDPNCDCHDGSPAIHPGADDPPGDGVDQDCSGADG